MRSSLGAVSRTLKREVVEPLLRSRFGTPYVWLASCPSTQRVLAHDAPEGAVAVAEEQTEGRGRLGRRWEAPSGTSILASLVLRPNVPAHRLPELSVLAGEAVAEALASATALHPEVRLPNDVLVHGRKVAGILAEANDGRVVLGIGVNVNQTAKELPADVRTQATSLRLECGAGLDRAELLARILEQLESRYDGWVAKAAAR